ncbi:demethoxyubiquinone hydroxylase family protein [Maricaulis salignorans]|uniref:Ubiquinone biosynthesis monooxygenase Coq7 n=1 Tax=Maricaulis salignorans TaxID=144026 RepID=A0A1G9T2I9_9PROT|nr:demethoxyubiquinone hydroxylase family protein [Maricaulis salignorans]SDM41964.1 ubiquinone biosynthesis monooxygenase Coq7 [Maricaulis salignorans]
MTNSDIDAQFPLERTRRRILRVNTAGEAGAIAIYSAQLVASRILRSETATFLRAARVHEMDHHRRFRLVMVERGLSPCPGTVLWVAGGWLLGLISLLGGERGIMACTAAIESTVHGHLNEQIRFLQDRDPELAGVIESIRVEEEEHLEHGLAGYDAHCRVARIFTGIVSAVTEALIWIATFGDSARLRAEYSDMIARS